MSRPPEPNPDRFVGGVNSLLDRPVDDLGDLAVVVGGSADSFKGQLLALMAKADPGNRARLAAAFPYEYGMFVVWQEFADSPTWRQLHAAYVARNAAEQMGEQPC